MDPTRLAYEGYTVAQWRLETQFWSPFMKVFLKIIISRIPEKERPGFATRVLARCMGTPNEEFALFAQPFMQLTDTALSNCIASFPPYLA